MISGGYGTHTLGRFRILATADSNATYGDGNNNAGVGAATSIVILLCLLFLSKACAHARPPV